MLSTTFDVTWEVIALCWFHQLVIIDKDFNQLLVILNVGSDKSFVDDLVASGYCKCESCLCTTRHWGLSRVPMICSSLFPNCLIWFVHLCFQKAARFDVNYWCSRTIQLRQMNCSAHFVHARCVIFPNEMSHVYYFAESYALLLICSYLVFMADWAPQRSLDFLGSMPTRFSGDTTLKSLHCPGNWRRSNLFVIYCSLISAFSRASTTPDFLRYILDFCSPEFEPNSWFSSLYQAFLTNAVKVPIWHTPTW